jgi:hypothetical protein
MQWITDALNGLPAKYPAVKALVWFNWRIYERNVWSEWPVESSASALAAFQSGIASSYFVGRP